MKCNHLTTVAWATNNGNLHDKSQDGQPMAVQTPNGPILRLRLCRDCGTTFGGKPTRRATAATSRQLKEKVKK